MKNLLDRAKYGLFEGGAKKKVQNLALQRKVKQVEKTADETGDGLFIECEIAYEPGARLGFAYNRLMNLAYDWVLLMDQDLFISNPNWYRIMLEAIRKCGDDTGWFTCWTNRLSEQMKGVTAHPDAPKDDDINNHRRFAKKIWEKNRYNVTDLTDETFPISGHWILTRKKVWETVGGFKESNDGLEGMLTVDKDYFNKIKDKGYKIRRMDGLYVYHHYGRDWLWK